MLRPGDSNRSLGLLLLAALALSLPAHAEARPQIGIGDQNPSVFANPFFAPLELRYARIVVPWNAATRRDYWPRVLNAWLKGARANRIEPHIAFGEPTYDPRLLGQGPTPARYARAFKAFRKRWPQVRVFTPWNEATHSHAATFHRPGLAARYYETLVRLCRSCKVVAADLLDLPNATSWLRRFLATVRGKPRLWGLHNYRDANRGHSVSESWTLKLTRMVKGRIWITESGGITGLAGKGGKDTWPYSPRRAARSLKHLFRLVDSPQLRTRVRRVYVYHFYGTWGRNRRTNGWDSGLLALNGKPRPAYRVLKRIAAQRRGSRAPRTSRGSR